MVSCLSKNRARQTDWLKIIEKELETGDLRSLLTVYCIFALGDGQWMQRAGRAIQKRLEHLTLGQMIGLYERFRTFTSLGWWIDWSAVSLEPIRKKEPEKLAHEIYYTPYVRQVYENAFVAVPENRPAVDLIQRFNFNNVFIYADPPYVLNTRHGKQYCCEMDNQAHNELLDEF